MKRFPTFVFSFLLAITSTGAATRIWTDQRGSTVKGEYIRLDGSTITLLVNGRTYSFPLARLSLEDQAFARRLAAAAANPASTKNTSDWPRWRGPQGDGVSRETGLLKQWPSNGPRLLWTTSNLGQCYSSVIVTGDRIFTLGENGGATSIHALERTTGKIVWSTPIRGGGGANGTPAFDPDNRLVYGITKNGNLACVKASSGELVWQKNFARDFGGKMMSGWGYSESPLVDGPWLVCSPSGPDAAIVALDKRTGGLVWSAPFPRDMGRKGKDGAGYGSVAILETGGSKQYLQMTGRGLLAVDARTGRNLWHYNKIANGTANVPSPVVDGDRVFASTGYGDGGSALLQVTRSGAREIKYYSSGELQNHHGGMVLLDGHVYGGHGHNKGEPFCLDMRSGRIVWKVNDPAVRKMESAAVTCADGHLYFRYQNGTVKLIEATTRGYREKGSFQIPNDRKKSWQHPVVTGGRLYLRAQNVLHCYDVRGSG
ncbi:MAG: PQQ-binding-like beta-propeller repeat protein [Opitutales bacterium]